MSIKAVIFDMDGVLVHSEPALTYASMEALKDWGIQAKAEDFLEFTGMGEDSFVGGVARKYGLDYIPEMKLRAYEIYLDIVDTRLGRIEDAVPLVERLHAAGYRLAVASAADKVKVEANLGAAGLRKDLFHTILWGECVARKKPYPDMYLRSVEKLGYRNDECVVIEDALAGLTAAHGAGVRCMCVTTTFDEATLKAAGADWILPRLWAAYDIIEGENHNNCD